MDKERAKEVLQMIADDVKADATTFDGQPFTGRTMAEYMGNHGAAIAALCGIVRQMLEEPVSVVAVDPSAGNRESGPRA